MIRGVKTAPAHKLKIAISFEDRAELRLHSDKACVAHNPGILGDELKLLQSSASLQKEDSGLGRYKGFPDSYG